MRRSASLVKTLKVPPQVSYRAGRWRSKRNLSNMQRAAIPSPSFRGATCCVISKRYCTSKYPEKGELGSKPQGPTQPHLSVHPTQEIVSVYLLWLLEGCLFFQKPLETRILKTLTPRANSLESKQRCQSLPSREQKTSPFPKTIHGPRCGRLWGAKKFTVLMQGNQDCC